MINIFALICIISFAVYANVIFYKSKRNGKLTRDDIDELEENMKIW